MAAGSGDRRAGDSLDGRARRTPAEIFEPSKLSYTPYPQLGNNSAYLLSFSSFLNELNIKQVQLNSLNSLSCSNYLPGHCHSFPGISEDSDWRYDVGPA